MVYSTAHGLNAKIRKLHAPDLAGSKAMANLPSVNHLLGQSNGNHNSRPTALKRSVSCPDYHPDDHSEQSNGMRVSQDAAAEGLLDAPAMPPPPLRKAYTYSSNDSLERLHMCRIADVSHKRRKFQIYPYHNSSDRKDLDKLDNATFKHARTQPLTRQFHTLSSSEKDWPEAMSAYTLPHYGYHSPNHYPFHGQSGLSESEELFRRVSASRTLCSLPSVTRLNDVAVPEEVRLQSSATKSMLGNAAGTTPIGARDHPADMHSVKAASPATQADRPKNLARGKIGSKPRKSRNRNKGSEKSMCLSCYTTSTPEWRKGPAGPRTLCNACGLLFAKNCRKQKQDAALSRDSH